MRIAICRYCSKEYKPGRNSYGFYCSNKCQQQYLWDERKKLIEQEGECKSSRIVKKYLVEVRTHKCEICGISEWLGTPVLLILDHIDGNSENCALTNLRLICSNCDATLPTYKCRNKGNGRHARRARYARGKSY